MRVYRNTIDPRFCPMFCLASRLVQVLQHPERPDLPEHRLGRRDGQGLAGDTMEGHDETPIHRFRPVLRGGQGGGAQPVYGTDRAQNNPATSRRDEPGHSALGGAVGWSVRLQELDQSCQQRPVEEQPYDQGLHGPARQNAPREGDG